jgi:hypothetical protein
MRVNKNIWIEDGQPKSVFHDDPPSKGEIQQIDEALNVSIAVGYLLDYCVQSYPDTADDFRVIIISASFLLFRDGTTQVIVDKDRNIRGSLWEGEEHKKKGERKE